MIITIDQLESQTDPIRGPGVASLSLRVYDREKAILLWHDRDEQHAWGGLLGNLFAKGSAKANNCAMMTGSMVMKLPKRGGSKP